ncbi:MAG: HPP family protein [Gammaproteobacteria bacterium]|nr:HPP family protein [Gammaproteobacteria bacterium]
MLKKLQRFLGVERSSTSNSDKTIATIGGMIGISATYLISYLTLDAESAALIVPSMGASAVLLFAVPHGPLSQPWSLFMGHLISAFVGVCCYLLVPDIILAAGLAVGLSIGAMHALNCIHPPGGATALAAVIGGPVIHELGFMYILSPIYINVLVIFIVAIIFNSAFAWRRYPVCMMRFIDNKDDIVPAKQRSPLKDQHIEQAIKDMNLIVDVTTADLQRLFLLSLKHSESDRLQPKDILLGHYYSNGKHGKSWSVRQVIDESPNPEPDNDLIIYRCSEGAHYGRSNSCTREQFARWAAKEVIKNSSEH